MGDRRRMGLRLDEGRGDAPAPHRAKTEDATIESDVLEDTAKGRSGGGRGRKRGSAGGREQR